MGGLVARIVSPGRTALLAGSWLFLTSFASCVTTRAGLWYPFNGILAGLFSGSTIGMAARWPPDQVRQTMAFSAFLSAISHHMMEKQQKDTTPMGCDDFAKSRVTDPWLQLAERAVRATGSESRYVE